MTTISVLENSLKEWWLFVTNPPASIATILAEPNSTEMKIWWPSITLAVVVDYPIAVAAGVGISPMYYVFLVFSTMIVNMTVQALVLYSVLRLSRISISWKETRA